MNKRRTPRSILPRVVFSCCCVVLDSASVVVAGALNTDAVLDDDVAAVAAVAAVATEPNDACRGKCDVEDRPDAVDMAS